MLGSHESQLCFLGGTLISMGRLCINWLKRKFQHKITYEELISSMYFNVFQHINFTYHAIKFDVYFSGFLGPWFK